MVVQECEIMIIHEFSEFFAACIVYVGSDVGVFNVEVASDNCMLLPVNYFIDYVTFWVGSGAVYCCYLDMSDIC